MRLPRFLLAATLACFLSVFISPSNSSYLNSNSISFLSKIPLALVFISKEINGREIWVPKSVAAIMPMQEEDGSIQDEYSQVANTFAKPGSKVIKDEEVVSDQPYPYISLAEEWKLAHLQSPYVLKRKQGSSSKKTYSSDEALGETESEDGDDSPVSSSDEQEEEEETVVPSLSSVEEEEEEGEEDDEPVPQGEIEGPPEEYSSELPPPPLPLDDGSEEQGGSEEEDEESDETSSSSSSKVPLQALSHVDEVDEDDSTETNLELIPDEVKDAIVREMAKQFAQQTRISASKIKKEIRTTKPKRDNVVVDKSNDREVVRVTYDHRVTDSDGPYNDLRADSSEKKKPVRDRVTSSDGPYREGKGKGKKKKGKGKGKGHGHGWGWKPPPKIWHPPPPPEHYHKKVRDGLLEQWTRGSQWERILHSYHDYKDQLEHDHKHGHKDDGEGPIHKHKPGLAQKLLKGSFWERAFVTYANYKKQQQNKGGHELAGEGWAPYDR